MLGTLDRKRLPGHGDVTAAATQLAGIASRTPVLRSAAIDAQRGAQFFFKMESLQLGGAFKFRGAYNALSRLPLEARRLGVVAFSSGNHAQAVALAGRMLGIPATIVMPQDAPRTKLDATRAHGARVILYDRHADDREAITAELSTREGLTLIPPFDHPDVIAGQGTAALELFAEVEGIELLYVPVSGGGLIAGCALAAEAAAPGCRIVGVEPETANDAQQSIAAGRIVEIAVPDTIADGARVTRLGALTFDILRTRVETIATVTDAALRRAMGVMARELHQIVEPTGCLGVAAALAEAPPGARVGVVVSGGNVDLPDFCRHLRADAAHG